MVIVKMMSGRSHLKRIVPSSPGSLVGNLEDMPNVSDTFYFISDSKETNDKRKELGQ